MAFKSVATACMCLCETERRELTLHVNQTQLDPRLWKDAFNRLGKAGPPIPTSNENSLDAPILQLGQHGQPELGALVGREPDPKPLLVPTQSDTQRQIDGFIADAL